MNKKIILVGLALLALFLYWKRDSFKSLIPKNVSATTPKNNITTVGGDKTPADIFHTDTEVISQPNVLDFLTQGFTGLTGGILSDRYANYGDVKLSSQVTGKVGAVENLITVQNLTSDKIQFAVFSEIDDINGFSENVDKEQVTLEPKQTRTINFTQACRKGQKTAVSLAWTSLVNPIPVSDRIQKVVVAN